MVDIIKNNLSFSYDDVKHLLYVDFFDDSINLNGSQIPKKEFKNIVDQIPEIPFRIEHKYGIDNIKGHFTSGEIKDNHVYAFIDVQDIDTQVKFKNGTYKLGEAGMSPAFNWDCTMTCSICGDNYRECEHFSGEKYDGKECYAILSNTVICEGSLTDSPAYAKSSGKVLDVMFTKNGEKTNLMFSVNKMKKENMEMKQVKQMKLNTKEKTIMAEEGTKPTEEVTEEATEETNETNETAEVEEKKTETTEETTETAEETTKTVEGEVVTEASTKDKTETETVELAKLSKRIDELEAEKFKMKSEARKVELLKYTNNDAVVKHILSKNMTDKQFSTELANVKILTQEHSVKGSGTESKKVPDNYYKIAYGVDSARDAAVKILGVKL